MSEAVTVTGTPQITFTMGGNPVVASYTGGSGTAALTFTGTAPAGNGTSVSLTSIDLTGDTVIGNGSTQGWVTSTVGQTTSYTLDNTAPVVTTTALNAAENGTAVGTLAGTDANVPLTWALSGAGVDNAKFSITSGGVLTLAAVKNFEAPDDVGANGVYNITVVATDAAGNASAAQALAITLTNVNEAPTVANIIPDQSFTVGSAGTFQFAANTFADVDASTTFTYTAIGMPAGITFNGATRTFSGTPTAGGSASITVTASDGAMTASDTFVLTSASLPVLAATQALDGVTNLDVRSALVIAFNQAVTLNTTGTQQITIFDDMGTAGWTVTNTTSGESKQDVFDNDVVITMTSGVATAVTIGGADYTSRFDLANSVKVSGSNLVINLLPAAGPAAGSASTAGSTDSTPFDWDFGANYHVNLGAGVVVANGMGNAALTDATTLNFTTVAPVSAAAGAASLSMDSTGASAATSAGSTWHNAHVQDATSPGLALDFSVGSHALYIQSDGGNTKSSTITGRVLLSNVNTDDVIYMDNSGNMALASTQGVQAAVYTKSIATSDLTRSLANSDGGTGQDVVFSNLNAAWTNVTSLNGGDNTLENATHFNANVVIFG